MGTKNYNYHLTYFSTSVSSIDHLPRDTGIEIAFAGRSNAGKSSALNALTNQNDLARTSKMPGRTQMINLFEVEDSHRLADLPGYGYSKLPKELILKWQRTLNKYLKIRQSLKGVVVLMDIRHPLKHADQQIIQRAINLSIPVLVLLTKADKLAYGARTAKLHMVREAVVPFMANIQVEIFSATEKIGIDKLSKNLNLIFNKNATAVF
ncbi:Probable GTP-binding protein EngB [Serratia symbiotica]|nr:Probable GTP-binding protein EngB [Serratia symbiotica]